MIRNSIQSTGVSKGREYIELLHRDFPEFMDEESGWYVSDANEMREVRGLPALQL